MVRSAYRRSFGYEFVEVATLAEWSGIELEQRGTEHEVGVVTPAEQRHLHGRGAAGAQDRMDVVGVRCPQVVECRPELRGMAGYR